MDYENQKLYLVRGIPGSSKSTKARELVSQNPDMLHFEADMFFEKDGEYKFNPSLIGHAHAWCIKSACDALQRGKSVVVANTFIKLRELKPYIQQAEKMGIPYEVIHMTGQFKNVHNVPDEVVERMLANFQPYEQNSQETVY